MPAGETRTTLCNYALSKIGGGGETLNSFRIESINDSSDETANLCLDLYEQIRREVLCRADWNEATKFADLGAELSGVDKADWEYAFNLPSDYLGRCKQVNETFLRSTNPRHFAEYDKKIMGRILLTNNYTNEAGDSTYIKYIWDLKSITRFSALLFEAFATKMAAELSGTLLADSGKRRERLLVEYEELVLPLAEGAMAMEDGDDSDYGEYTAITCRTE